MKARRPSPQPASPVPPPALVPLCWLSCLYSGSLPPQGYYYFFRLATKQWVLLWHFYNICQFTSFLFRAPHGCPLTRQLLISIRMASHLQDPFQDPQGHPCSPTPPHPRSYPNCSCSRTQNIPSAGPLCISSLSDLPAPQPPQTTSVASPSRPMLSVLCLPTPYPYHRHGLYL